MNRIRSCWRSGAIGALPTAFCSPKYTELILPPSIMLQEVESISQFDAVACLSSHRISIRISHDLVLVSLWLGLVADQQAATVLLWSHLQSHWLTVRRGFKSAIWDTLPLFLSL